MENLKQGLFVLSEKTIVESRAVLQRDLGACTDARALSLHVLKKNVDILQEEIAYLEKRSDFEECFNDPDPEQPNEQEVRFEQVKDFVMNILLSCKLEPQMLIVSLVYLERFIAKSGVALTPRNWKRLVLICFVVASKIWDDESFENHNFSQVFSEFDTRKLNLMEKIFLQHVEYDLFVALHTFSRYFFYLKTFSQEIYKTPGLNKLTFDEIRLGTRGGAREEAKMLKRNKSFHYIL